MAPLAMPHSSPNSRFHGAHIFTPGYTCTPRPIFAPKHLRRNERQECSGLGLNLKRHSTTSPQIALAIRLPFENDGPVKVSWLYTLIICSGNYIDLIIVSALSTGHSSAVLLASILISSTKSG